MADPAFLNDENLGDLLDRNLDPIQYGNIFENYDDIQISTFEDDYSLFLLVKSRISHDFLNIDTSIAMISMMLPLTCMTRDSTLEQATTQYQ
jgi:hypothetical protein